LQQLFQVYGKKFCRDHLQWGHQGGTKNWGRMGYTNAALLYPDALMHLLGQIGFTQKTG
jgi:hypothetical protein